MLLCSPFLKASTGLNQAQWPGYKPIVREVEPRFIYDHGLLFHALVLLVQELCKEPYNVSEPHKRLLVLLTMGIGP